MKEAHIFVHLRRPFLSQVEKRLQIEKEEKAAALSKKVAQASLEQLEAKLGIDMASLEKHLPSKESAAAATQLDMKYIKTRQRTLSGMAQMCGHSSL